MSVLDPMVSGLYSQKMDLVSSPSGTEMNSVIQMGSKVYVSSGDIIDVFDSSIWKWTDPITNLGGNIVAMTTDGNYMYVATEDSTSVQELDSMGNLTRLWGVGDFTDESILDIAHMVKKNIGPKVNIIKKISNDDRSYRISSSKIYKKLNFKI